MTQASSSDIPGTSTRPYLIRALHDWCTDNGFTPYLAVHVDRAVQVPMEYVKNDEIVLNIGFEATSSLKLGNDLIEFRARFGGISREILVPVDHVVAIYARENGQGMAFPMAPESESQAEANEDNTQTAEPASTARGGLRLAPSPSVSEPSETDEKASPRSGETDNHEPPSDGPKPGPGTSRPTLKRIK